MIESIGEIAKLATTLLTMAQKKPLTDIEKLEKRIEAEAECTEAIQRIDKAEREGQKESAQLFFHDFIDSLWKL